MSGEILLLVSVPRAVCDMAETCADPDQLTRFLTVDVDAQGVETLDKATALCITSAVGIEIGRTLRRGGFAAPLLTV